MANSFCCNSGHNLSHFSRHLYLQNELDLYFSHLSLHFLLQTFRHIFLSPYFSSLATTSSSPPFSKSSKLSLVLCTLLPNKRTAPARKTAKSKTVSFFYLSKFSLTFTYKIVYSLNFTLIFIPCFVENLINNMTYSYFK